LAALSRHYRSAIRSGTRVKRKKERYCTWDALHGEIEVLNKQGKHIGVVDAVSGELIKDAVEGRSINVLLRKYGIASRRHKKQQFYELTPRGEELVKIVEPLFE
jgi:hypothetical protein